MVGESNREQAAPAREGTGDVAHQTKRRTCPPKPAVPAPRREDILRALDLVFGPLAESNPERWDERAYLLLAGLVCLYLATTKEISTKELSASAKALADARRARPLASAARRKRETAGTELPATDAAASSGVIDDLVRQVYGVSVPNEGSA